MKTVFDIRLAFYTLASWFQSKANKRLILIWQHVRSESVRPFCKKLCTDWKYNTPKISLHAWSIKCVQSPSLAIVAWTRRDVFVFHQLYRNHVGKCRAWACENIGRDWTNVFTNEPSFLARYLVHLEIQIVQRTVEQVHVCGCFDVSRILELLQNIKHSYEEWYFI